jgi:hypothetical protein
MANWHEINRRYLASHGLGSRSRPTRLHAGNCLALTALTALSSLPVSTPSRGFHDNPSNPVARCFPVLGHFASPPPRGRQTHAKSKTTRQCKRAPHRRIRVSNQTARTRRLASPFCDQKALRMPKNARRRRLSSCPCPSCQSRVGNASHPNQLMQEPALHPHRRNERPHHRGPIRIKGSKRPLCLSLSAHGRRANYLLHR